MPRIPKSIRKNREPASQLRGMRLLSTTKGRAYVKIKYSGSIFL